MSERRLPPEEVEAILRRAAAMDARPDLPALYDPTLTDLMDAAAEVGLDPAVVRRAAAILPAPKRGVSAAILGAPDRREVRAALPGVSVPESRHDLARVAQNAFDSAGEVVESASERWVWRERHLGGQTTVSVETADGVTEVHVTADRAGHYLGGWFAAFVAWSALSALTPLGALTAATGAMGLTLGYVAAPLLLARPFWTRADRLLRRRLDRAVLDILGALEEEAP